MKAGEPRQSNPAEVGPAARLREIEGELVRLRYRHDIAMSAFRFEEATALGRQIAMLEREQQALLAEVPAPVIDKDATTGVVPRLDRPRRRRR